MKRRKNNRNSSCKGIGKDKKYVDERLPIISLCQGCKRVEQLSGKSVCSKYLVPSFHWENDQVCAFATHVQRIRQNIAKKINPLKASKRLKRKIK